MIRTVDMVGEVVRLRWDITTNADELFAKGTACKVVGLREGKRVGRNKVTHKLRLEAPDGRTLIVYRSRVDLVSRRRSRKGAS